MVVKVIKLEIEMLKKIKKLVIRRLTKQYWESSLSNKWHIRREEQFQGDIENFAYSVMKNVDDFDYKNVLEVGTGTGYLVRFLSEKLNNYDGFIGVDINKNLIEKNIKSYKDIDKLSFVCSDIYDYIENLDLDDLLIVAQNTFDYFTKRELEELCLLILNKFDNVGIVINSHKTNKNIKDSIDRTDSDFKVYSHNYIEILRKSGFELVESEEINQNQNSGIIVLAHSKEK